MARPRHRELLPGTVANIRAGLSVPGHLTHTDLEVLWVPFGFNRLRVSWEQSSPVRHSWGGLGFGMG